MNIPPNNRTAVAPKLANVRGKVPSPKFKDERQTETAIIERIPQKLPRRDNKYVSF